jgi:hypothetical protein
MGRVREILPRFYDAIAIAGPDVLVAEWPRRASVQDVVGRANEWERQRAEEGDWLRELQGEEIVRLPMDAYDEALIAACQETWTDSIRAIARVLAEKPTSDLVLAWRIRELLDRGALIGRGPSNRAGLPQELFVSPANDNI